MKGICILRIKVLLVLLLWSIKIKVRRRLVLFKLIKAIILLVRRYIWLIIIIIINISHL